MFSIVFQQLLKMIIIMAIAFFCFKVKWVNQEGNRSVSNLLLLVVNPCLILTVYQTDYDAVLVRGLLYSFLTAIIAHVIAIVFCHFCIPAKENKNYAIERFGCIYSNCGFIGIPLIMSVLGTEGVFYITAYLTVFNILNWTHGLVLLNGDCSFQQIKQGLLSPMILATTLAMILFFTQIKIPATLLASMQYLADMNTPLAMLIAGFSVAQADLKKILSNRRIYVVSSIKLLIIPLLVLVALSFLPVDSKVAYTTLIASACPTAVSLTSMCIRFEKNYIYASEIFSFTTVCSVITIPIIVYIAGFVL
jgi:hypothetical protein